MSDRNPFGQRNDGGSCTCSECGRRFTGLTGFDLHLVPEHADGSAHVNPKCKCSEWTSRCRSDEELRGLGYEPNGRGWWGRADRVDARWTPPVRMETAA